MKKTAEIDKKIAQISDEVANADDLLKLARAKQIFSSLDRRKKKSFPWETAIKYTAVAVGALIGAAILIVSEVTSYFWDSYKFASTARDEAQIELKNADDELEQTHSQLSAVTSDLTETKQELLAAEEDRDRATNAVSNARDELVEANNRLSAAQIALRDLETELEVRNGELRDVQSQIQAARIASTRMYSCEREFVVDVFDHLSQHYRLNRFDQATSANPPSRVYLSVQLINDQTFQYVANAKRRSNSGYIGPDRTEFGHWSTSGSIVTLDFSMKNGDVPRERIAELSFRSNDLADFAGGFDRVEICSREGVCFHRYSTCEVAN